MEDVGGAQPEILDLQNQRGDLTKSSIRTITQSAAAASGMISATCALAWKSPRCPSPRFSRLTADGNMLYPSVSPTNFFVLRKHEKEPKQFGVEDAIT